jgi:hypothetical protein
MKIQLSITISDKLSTKKFLNDYIDLLLLDWKNIEDFRKRYDHTVNKESFANDTPAGWLMITWAT